MTGLVSMIRASREGSDRSPGGWNHGNPSTDLWQRLLQIVGVPLASTSSCALGGRSRASSIFQRRNSLLVAQQGIRLVATVTTWTGS